MKRKNLASILIAGLLITSLGSAIPSKATTTTEQTTATTATASTDSAITVTAPITPQISIIKGGTKRVKLYWGKISDASGYNIYYSTSKSGTYTKIKTITNNETVKYVKTGLTQNKTYYFKMTAYKTVNGVTAESSFSSVKSAKTVAVSATSKSAKKYTTKSKFTASAAYKKFNALKKYATYSKSFAIPGMKTTNNGGFASKKMIPQGLCQAGGYMLISAYDATGYDESVIYVLSRSSHSYITTIVLPSKAKVNSLAYDGKNIWISKGTNIAYFPYSVITDAVSSGSSYYTLKSYTDFFSVKTSAGVIAYHDNVLWVGKAGSSSTSTMYGYTIDNVDGKTALTSTYSMTIPTRTQGIAFDSDGYMYLTRSNKTASGANYISRIQTFKPSLTAPTATGAIKKGSIIKKLSLPPKAEGVAVYGSYQYTLYSGCKYTSCKYPVDRVIATKLTQLR